jgi:hypothetical protein
MPPSVRAIGGSMHLSPEAFVPDCVARFEAAGVGSRLYCVDTGSGELIAAIAWWRDRTAPGALIEAIAMPRGPHVTPTTAHAGARLLLELLQLRLAAMGSDGALRLDPSSAVPPWLRMDDLGFRHSGREIWVRTGSASRARAIRRLALAWWRGVVS